MYSCRIETSYASFTMSLRLKIGFLVVYSSHFKIIPKKYNHEFKK